MLAASKLIQQYDSKPQHLQVIEKLLNTIATRRLTAMILTILLIFVQTGCGGGGGSSNAVVRDSLVDFVVREGPAEVVKSANSAPIPGSVTQSSAGDTVQATVSGSSSSGFPDTVDVTINGIRQNPNDYTIYSTATIRSDHATYHSGIYYSGEDFDNDPSTDTWLVGEITTDWEGSGDTDYLVGGIWAVVPKKPADRHLLNIGVFIDGNDKFIQNNLAGLSGTADYVGDASGVYADSEGAAFVAGTARLTADFNDSSQLGTIGGTVTKFYYTSNQVSVPNSPTLNFHSANIGPTDSGFFKGTTSMTYENKEYSGQWGGQFFGNGGTKPGSVAGTFGGKAADDSASFLGIFGSYLDSSSQ